LVSDRDLTQVLRDLVETDPEHGLVVLTADRRVLFANAAARSHLLSDARRSSGDGSASADGHGAHGPGRVGHGPWESGAGSPQTSSPVSLPQLLDRHLLAFAERLSSPRSPAVHAVYYPSDADRRLRVTLEAFQRDHLPLIVVRSIPATPWSEPTVRRLQVRYDLTIREAEVAAGVCKGFTNAEVAGQLGIMEKTVKNTLMSVFTKLSVRNRVELALRAHEAPLPHLPPS
jgi:DNA-binding CsgD family transcriptional regulator